MPVRPPTFRAKAARTPRQVDKDRGSATSRGYDWAWAKASKRHLQDHPLCRYCALNDRVAAATLTDHLYPHNGDRNLFWIEGYWISSCTPCHSGFKQAIEARGKPALDDLARRLGLPPLGGGGSKTLGPLPS